MRQAKNFVEVMEHLKAGKLLVTVDKDPKTTPWNMMEPKFYQAKDADHAQQILNIVGFQAAANMVLIFLAELSELPKSAV